MICCKFRANPDTLLHDKSRDKERSKNLGKWRKSHEDIDARKKAYWESIPAQVWASMAFEGEHVDIEMLEEYLKTLKDTP